jgi:DNA invertase Pin-like site-specific DNA recombinase
MRTALDVRVSTIHPKPDLQVDSLRRYAIRAGWAIVAAYLDVAISDRKEGSPQLYALMHAARYHACDGVLVWEFDRFARSVAHLLKALEECHHLGMRCISVQDHVDTESRMGQAMFTGIGVMAE